MKINWFPGHMKKTLDKMREDIKNVDIVMYVLDARAPFSCFNPSIDEIVKGRDSKLLYVINKCDLISQKDENKIIQSFEGKNVLCVQGNNKNFRQALLNKLMELVKQKYDNFMAKGVFPIFKVMVIGTPNTGKSTIINTLCSSKKKTMTGDKAGVTKITQWVKINENFALLDTPGTLWPRFEEELLPLKLAFIGSIKKEVVDEEELGFEFVKFMLEKDSSFLEQRYGVSDFDREPIEIYDEILLKSGCVRKGGEVDYSRGASKVLEDFRSGRLGKICLDLV